MKSSKSLKRTTRYTNHVFATFTFRRDSGILETWGSVNNDFNRFIQRIRRVHMSGLQYLRTIEAHTDDYPHIHAILQFPEALTVTDNKFFDAGIYLKWKGLWRSGLSDFQAPYARTSVPIFYILKYISKSTPTYKTLWRKLLSNVASEAVKKNSALTIQHKSDASPVLRPDATTPAPTKQDSTLFFCKQFKIKQMTWSRSYKFPALPERYSFDASLDKFKN